MMGGSCPKIIPGENQKHYVQQLVDFYLATIFDYIRGKVSKRDILESLHHLVPAILKFLRKHDKRDSLDTKKLKLVADTFAKRINFLRLDYFIKFDAKKMKDYKKLDHNFTKTFPLPNQDAKLAMPQERQQLVNEFFDLNTLLVAAKRNEEIVQSTQTNFQDGIVGVYSGAAHTLDLKQKFEKQGVAVTILGAKDLRDLVEKYNDTAAELGKKTGRLETVCKMLGEK